MDLDTVLRVLCGAYLALAVAAMYPVLLHPLLMIPVAFLDLLWRLWHHGDYSYWQTDPGAQAYDGFSPRMLGRICRSSPRSPRPLLPGGCWKRLFVRPRSSMTDREAFAASRIFMGQSLPDWLPTPSLRHLLAIQGTKFVAVASLGNEMYHVVPLFVPHPSPRGRQRYRVYLASRLPRGWYGMGPDFFADSPLRTAALALSIGDYARQHAHAQLVAPNEVRPSMRQHLRHAGIPEPNPGAPPHSHPVHKAFELLSLHVAARLLAGYQWHALWLRQEKALYMTNTPGCQLPQGYWNPRYQAKDITRYSRTPAPAVSDPDSPCPVWFAHDALHHLSPTTVGRWFDVNPSLQYAVFTTVIPPETVFNLPALTPELYSFERDGDNLIYIPEGNGSESYIQPFSARQWLSAHRLVTPMSECLHVSLVHSVNAHHVIVVSRPQLLPERHRVMDMPELTEISFWAHPFGSQFSRLTMPSLLAALEAYSVRVSATNLRDLYSKVASHQAEVYGRYPASYVRAAALSAIRLRAMDWHASPSWQAFLWLWTGELTKLPLLPISFAMQSLSSLLYARRLDISKVWVVSTTHLVAHRTDLDLPGLTRRVCNEWDVPFFYTPPNPSLSARMAHFSSTLHVFWLVKMSLFIAERVADYALPFIPGLVNAFTYALQLDWVYTPLGFVMFLLTFWFGWHGPTIPWPNPVPRVKEAVKWLYASLFFLPYAQLPFRAGLWVGYQVSLLLLTLHLLWPRFNPWVFRADDDFSRLVTRSVCAGLWLLSLLYGLQFRGNELPHHDAAHHPRKSFDEECPPPPPPPRSSSSGDDGMSEFRFQDSPAPTPCPTPPVMPSRPVTPDWPEDIAGPAAFPMPHVLPADPYWQYRVPPSSYDDFQQWGMVLTRLPLPPNVLDPDHSCVWHCLSSTLGVSSDLVHAVWMSQLPLADRPLFANGAVPAGDLARVYAYFRVGVTQHNGTIRTPDCPRAPGAAPAEIEFDRQQPPMLRTAAAQGWPSNTFFLGLHGNGDYHLTTEGRYRQGAHSGAPNHGAMVGYFSRQLTAVELGSMLNYPVRTMMQSWSRLAGFAPNVASIVMGLNGVGLPPLVNLPAVPVSAQTLAYTLTPRDLDLACHLGQDLKNNPATLDLRDYPMASIGRGAYELAKAARNRVRSGQAAPSVRLHMFHGAPGTGKTYSALRWLAARPPPGGFNPSNLRFHTWLNSLRGPLENDAMPLFPGLQSFNFQTGCMPLAQPVPGTIFFDDASQLWPGYLPLLIASSPGVTDIVLTFDCTQARSAFPVADALSRQDISTAEWLAPLSDRYATLAWRTSLQNSALFGLPAAAIQPGQRRLNGHTYVVSNVVNDLPLLVVSPRFATSQNEGGQRCLTFRECQGFTIDGDVTIDLGGLSATSTDHAWWTALTRARGNICLFLGPLTQGKGVNESLYGRSNIASALVAVAAAASTSRIDVASDVHRIVARAIQAHIARNISPAARATLGLPAPSPTVGHVSSQARADWLDAPHPGGLGDFWTARSHRSLTGSRTAPGAAFSRHTELPVNPSDSGAAYLLRHYASISADCKLTGSHSEPMVFTPPRLTGQPDPALNVDRRVDSERRERTLPNWNSTRQHVHDGPDAILHHTRADKLTASWAEQKRIKIGRDHAELNASERSRLKQLKRGFSKFFDVPAWNCQRWDNAAFERAAREAYAPWVSKRTKRQIRRSVDKNPIDSPLNMAHLFLKGQYIKKEHVRFGPAKAGQTISEFNAVRIFRDAPFALYLERCALRYAFDSTYLHCRASPADMDRWYTKHWTPGEMTASDYVAWDSGCDRVFLAFDCWLMELCGIPNAYIDKYRAERVTTFSYLGPHLVRQESGDRWTWILNSLRNAAITGASLRCPPRTPATFSGDDGNTLGHWKFSPDFRSDDWSMQPKMEYGTRITFCGYEFGGQHISVDPNVVLHRSQYGLALGRNDPDYWLSIKQAIAEAGFTAPDWSRVLSTARHNLVTACTQWGFPALAL